MIEGTDRTFPDPSSPDTIILRAGEYRRLYGDVLRLRTQLRFLLDRDDECLGDHPDWVRRIKALLDETMVHDLDEQRDADDAKQP